MTRVNPSNSQRIGLFLANAQRCCVCKRANVGLHLHHIDGNSSNTIDSNIAVLCVEDHDRHHRPTQYATRANHTDLSPEVILQHKYSWESFIVEARNEAPRVIATISSYGTEQSIHSMQLVMQSADEKVEYKRSFHLLDANLDRLTDEIIAEVQSIGKQIKLVALNSPLPIEHCPCCGSGYSRTLKSAMVTRLTDKTWQRDSACSVFVNPTEPSLAITIFLRDDNLFSASLHLCDGKFLHYANDYYEESIPLSASPSVRTQAAAIVLKVLEEWAPSKLLIGTGDHNSPALIDDLDLPRIWERRANQLPKKQVKPKHRAR